MDTDPGRKAGGGRESEREQGERRHGQREGRERRAVFRLLFLGEGAKLFPRVVTVTVPAEISLLACFWLGLYPSFIIQKKGTLSVICR